MIVTSVTDPHHGSATIAKGSLTYKLNAGFKGIDRFDYTVMDSNGVTATASVMVTVKVNAASD